MSTYFTSDNHYGHKNIVDYCGRPFRFPDGQIDVHAMNRTMTERWNAVVKPEDTVYHLGDFSMESIAKVREYRQKLNGRIVLVRGNHDRSAQGMLQAGFDEVHDRLELELDGYKLYLSHIPKLFSGEFPDRYKRDLKQEPPLYYDYWLCGHIHEKWLRRGKVINVGVDQWNFTPVTLKQLLEAQDG